MLGNAEKKIEKMVLKNKWESLSRFIDSNAETRLILATQCAKATEPGVNSILTKLIRDEDDRVQLEAVKSIGLTGKDHEVAQLQWVLSNISEDQKELKAALQESISKVRGKR